MTQKVHKLLNDSPIVRWSALLLVSMTMFFAYMFVDVLSPLQSILESTLGWDPETYGTFASSEYFLNVFVFFLIFAGIILDKMGIRFTAILSGVVMVIGASIKLYALTEYFNNGGFGYDGLNSFLVNFPPSAKLACIGFAIFGCGVEMAGVTVSRAIVKWFRGKELALAMGIEMAIARLGVFAVFNLSPILAGKMNPNVVTPVAFCTLLLCVGLLTFIVYSLMDKKLDKQVGQIQEEEEDPFKISDIGKLFTSKTFLIVAGLCVLYYSAIFPFQKFATNMLESRLGLSMADASRLFSYFPIGAMLLTPLLGFFLDKKGKGATMLIIGAVLVCTCHLIFALAPLTVSVAYIAIIILGVSFSLVPAALWPSVPKLVHERYLGSAYSVIFWIQNIGLFAFPILIGWTLNFSNPGMSQTNKNFSSLLNYSTYSVSKETSELARLAKIDNNNQEFVNEMDSIILYTSFTSEFPKVEAKIKQYESDIDAIVSPEVKEKLLYFAKMAKVQIDNNQREELKLTLKDFDQFVNSNLSADDMATLDGKLAFVNSISPLAKDSNAVEILADFTQRCAKYAEEKDTLSATFVDSVAILNFVKMQNSKKQLASLLPDYKNFSLAFSTNESIKIYRVSLSRISPYDYTNPMLIFASLGILAFILGVWLKIEDKRKKYGLELPNIESEKPDGRKVKFEFPEKKHD